MTDKKPEWRLVTQYGVESYQCGLKKGDRIRLIEDLVIRTYDEVPTGEVQKKGEIWTVLPGSKEDPGIVWLRQPDGERHTWDDDESIFEVFEVLDD
jgi:hypothetical protein